MESALCAFKQIHVTVAIDIRRIDRHARAGGIMLRNVKVPTPSLIKIFGRRRFSPNPNRRHYQDPPLLENVMSASRPENITFRKTFNLTAGIQITLLEKFPITISLKPSPVKSAISTA